ncbi:L,D-transpeptidase family protein [Sphingomonas sinipercae]|uniref:L,D-transpeptidase family protein n=1 Tax=Sphingomonas sinipercae TaxID=2714944 RepID=A0A6G7ZN92_9SPHN|nr:L,D-transpeptidase family protein [Sphingomonas sinipercae]QIL02389.1 L,D-transpeptidase family protein [Sphingomonas sinipercae]
MKRFVLASTALAALVAASTAYGQYVPPRGPVGAPPPPSYPPSPPPGYQPFPAPIQVQQPRPWTPPTPVAASFARPVEEDQPIEPVEIPASIEQGIDLIYIDPDIAPEVQQRTGVLDKLDFQDWTGAPIDLFTSVNPYYTGLRQALVKYQQRWGDLPDVAIPEGPTLKAASTGDRVALLRQRLGLAAGTSFDPALAKAVAEYQAAHGLKADGIAGAGTIASLNLGSDHYEKVIILNMERALRLPTSDDKRRYILIDAGAARLYMYEGGKPVDSMKVIVGDAKTQTPMMAAQMKYVSLNPYWNVPPELVKPLVADKVLEHGLTYLTDRDYQILSDWTEEATRLDPASIDWQAVSAGKKELRVRRGPGPWNSMGQMKFMLPNDFGIYLHDIPEASKAAFAGDDRWISNGCVRLEDAKRLQRWVFGGRTPVASGEADQRVDLPEPLPVYMTYFTAEPTATGVAFRTDHYNRDEPLLARVKLDGSNQLAAR